MSNWPFHESEDTPVVTVQQIIDMQRPIRYVIRDELGEWEFLDAANYDLADRRRACKFFCVSPAGVVWGTSFAQ